MFELGNTEMQAIFQEGNTEMQAIFKLGNASYFSDKK